MNEQHKSILNKVGENIRKLRFARGESLHVAYEIRAEYGVKLEPSYLSKMERGKTEIPLRTLVAVADYFGVKPGRLFEEDEHVSGAKNEH